MSLICTSRLWNIFALLQLIRASPPDLVKIVDHRSWLPRANQRPRAAFSGSCVPKFSPKQPISPCALPRICATITRFFSGMFQIISQRWPNKGLNLLPPIIKFQPLLPFSREWAVCTTILISTRSFNVSAFPFWSAPVFPFSSLLASLTGISTLTNHLSSNCIQMRQDCCFHNFVSIAQIFLNRNWDPIIGCNIMVFTGR